MKPSSHRDGEAGVKRAVGALESQISDLKFPIRVWVVAGLRERLTGENLRDGWA